MRQVPDFLIGREFIHGGDAVTENFLSMYEGLCHLTKILQNDAGAFAEVYTAAADLRARIEADMKTCVWAGMLALELMRCTNDAAERKGWPSPEVEIAVCGIDRSAAAFMDALFDGEPYRANAFMDGIRRLALEAEAARQTATTGEDRLTPQGI